VLDDIAPEAGFVAVAIVSRSGVPLAWRLPEEAHVDNFSTMAATLVGAVDVILTGLHKASSDRSVITTDGGVIVAQAITEGAFIVGVLGTLTAKAEAALEAAANRAKAVVGSDEL